MQSYATGDVSLGSAEEPYVSDMTHSYRLTEGRLIRYPMIQKNNGFSVIAIIAKKAITPMMTAIIRRDSILGLHSGQMYFSPAHVVKQRSHPNLPQPETLGPDTTKHVLTKL